MWMYQNQPQEFGTATWACHVGCGDYTHWRIAQNDVMRVPAQHSPSTWGRREEWLANIREQRLQERNEGFENNREVERRPSLCSIS
jgi:hypothetical protein